MYKSKIRHLPLISFLILICSCSVTVNRAELYLEKELRTFMPPRAQTLLNKDSVICYTTSFFLRKDYNFPDFNIFFLYKENSEYRLEYFTGYYKGKKYWGTLKRRQRKYKEIPKQIIRHKGPYIIDAQELFDFYAKNRMDMMVLTPVERSRDVFESVFVKMGDDSIYYKMSFNRFCSDSFPVKSEFLEKTANTIKKSEIKFRKKKVKLSNGIKVIYDL